METITVKTDTFKFNELSDDAKEHALGKLHDLNTDYEWWDSDFDDFETIGALMGINITNIFFSGFSSQGDGACFEGEYKYKKNSVREVKGYAPLDTELHEIVWNLFDIQRKHFYTAGAYIKHSGHYYHERCTTIDVYDAHTTYNEPSYAEDVKDILRSFMQWIYSNLSKQYDYLTSEEVIIETIDANDYNFTADGKLF